MRRLTTFTFMSLDGVMQAPGTPQEDPSGAFDYGGWSVHHWDEMMGQAMREIVAAPFDVLLGRRTYEILAAYWPYAGDSDTARRMNGATKHVVSSTLRFVEWSNARLLEGDVATAVAQLKLGEGPELQVQGSGELIQTLIAHDLVDAFRVWIFPVVLGRGKRLFGDGAPPASLALDSASTSTTGVLMNTYRPAGPLRAGSFALEATPEAEVERRRKAARESGG